MDSLPHNHAGRCSVVPPVPGWTIAVPLVAASGLCCRRRRRASGSGRRAEAGSTVHPEQRGTPVRCLEHRWCSGLQRVGYVQRCRGVAGPRRLRNLRDLPDASAEADPRTGAATSSVVRHRSGDFADRVSRSVLDPGRHDKRHRLVRGRLRLPDAPRDGRHRHPAPPPLGHRCDRQPYPGLRDADRDGRRLLRACGRHHEHAAPDEHRGRFPDPGAGDGRDRGPLYARPQPPPTLREPPDVRRARRPLCRALAPGRAPGDRARPRGGTSDRRRDGGPGPEATVLRHRPGGRRALCDGGGVRDTGR